MNIDWNLYLARYQQTRGGTLFGGAGDLCDCQLLLTEGEKSPLLVIADIDPAGGRNAVCYKLRARTMARLERDYTLHIRARSRVGSGVKGVLAAVGRENDFGFPEATRGRVITTDNKPFTRQVLGDLDLRNALIARKREYLKVCPAPQGEGWHLVEVGALNFEGTILGDSQWVTEIMTQDTIYMAPEDKEVILRAGSEHFNAQMDAFLDFLRFARRAVTAWRM